MIDYLFSHNILTGLFWESNSAEGKGSNYQQWLNRIRKTHSQLVYTTADGGLLKGYSERKFSDLEPFAILVRNELGDGVYHFTVDNDSEDVYFLIVRDNKIIGGSDKVVTRGFFDALISELSEGEFAELGITKISESWIESISASCQQRQLVIKRKLKLFVIGVAAASAFLLVILAVLLNMMLS